MNDLSSTPQVAEATNTLDASDTSPTVEVQPDLTEPRPSYVKLAMRNMVRKRGISLFHFALTAIGLLVALVGLSYITR